MRTAKLSLTFILPVLLVLSVAYAPLPLAAAPAHAAPDPINVLLGVYNATAYPYSFKPASYNISGYSGNYEVVKLDGVSTPNPANYYLDINLSQVASAGWPAGEFNLTVSTNGYAQQTPGDVVFAANIPVSLVKDTVHSDHGPLSGFHKWSYTAPNGQKYTFLLGNNSVIAPFAYDVPGGQYYVKAVFGANYVYASVAQEIILPGITVRGIVDTNEGPAGSTITIYGTGFSANGPVNLTWSYLRTGTPVMNYEILTANSVGQFTATITAPELALETPTGCCISGTIAFQANDTTTATLSNIAQWIELGREFTSIKEYSPASASWISYATPQGNGTLTTVSFYETQPMNITGAWFVPNSQVKIYFGSELLGTATTNSAGNFTVTVYVPVVAAGSYSVNFTDPLGYIYFSGSTVPTLVVSPSTVTPGQTVTISGYAFAAGATANVTWIGEGVGYYNQTYLAVNLPVGNNGMFRISAKVPSPVYGGVHYVSANDTASPTDVAYAQVTVNPSIALSPSTAPLGSTVTVTLNGLNYGEEWWFVSPSTGTWTSTPTPSSIPELLGAPFSYYGLAQDNIPTYVTHIFGNPYGYATTNISAVGYPMLHAIQLLQQVQPGWFYGAIYPWANGTVVGSNTSTYYINATEWFMAPVSGNFEPATYELVATAWLNVTGTTNTYTALSTQLSNAQSALSTQLSNVNSSLSSQISGASSSLSTQLSNVNSSLSSQISGASSSLSTQLSGIQGTLTNMQTSLTSLQSAVGNLGSSLSSDYNSLSSSLSSISSSLGSMSSTLSSLSSTVSSIGSTLSSMSSTLSTVQSEAAQISSVNSLVLAAVVIAIIVLVLEVVVLVRRR